MSVIPIVLSSNAINCPIELQNTLESLMNFLISKPLAQKLLLEVK